MTAPKYRVVAGPVREFIVVSQIWPTCGNTFGSYPDAAAATAFERLQLRSDTVPGTTKINVVYGEGDVVGYTNVDRFRREHV